MEEELASRGPVWIIENQCDVQRILGDADAIVKSLGEQVAIHFHQTDTVRGLAGFQRR